MKALVTGAFGFIGRHVARTLADRGYTVLALGHGAWDSDEWRMWGISDWYSSDVDLRALSATHATPEIVAHCAGSGSVSESIVNPLRDFQRNVDTTIAVLEYVRTLAPGAALVVPSSAAVYGLVDALPISLRTPLNPVSPYGVHKRVTESLCQSYAKHFGVRVAIVRLFSVFGIGLRKQLLWDACSRLREKNAIFMGTGAETRDLLHIDDAAELLFSAIKHASSACPIVNGGRGKALKVRTILEEVAFDFGTDCRIQFSGVIRKGDPQHYQADIAEAQEWGWRPTRDWKREVGAYVEWFQKGAF